MNCLLSLHNELSWPTFYSIFKLLYLITKHHLKHIRAWFFLSYPAQYLKSIHLCFQATVIPKLSLEIEAREITSEKSMLCPQVRLQLQSKASSFACISLKARSHFPVPWMPTPTALILSPQYPIHSAQLKNQKGRVKQKILELASLRCL